MASNPLVLAQTAAVAAQENLRIARLRARVELDRLNAELDSSS